MLDAGPQPCMHVADPDSKGINRNSQFCRNLLSHPDLFLLGLFLVPEHHITLGAAQLLVHAAVETTETLLDFGRVGRWRKLRWWLLFLYFQIDLLGNPVKVKRGI